MATVESLAVERQGYTRRRDAALGTLYARTGEEPDRVRDADRPKGQGWFVGLNAVDTMLAERLAALATEVDALKAEVAELRGKKGNK